MYCSRCGAAVADDARFCTTCGATVGQAPESPYASGPASEASATAPPSAAASTGRPALTGDLPASIRLCSAWRRLGAHLLDAVLVVLTLVVGWLVWSIIVWGRGQSPAKQLLGMRVVNRRTLTSTRRGRMFVREIPCKWIIGVFAGFTIIGFVVYFWLLWDEERQQLWDKMVETIVVNDPEGVLDPSR